MSFDRFYPYRTAAEQIALDLTPPEGTGYRKTTDGSIVAYEEAADSITLDVAVCVTDDLFEEVIAPVERGNPPVEVRLVYGNRESRKRSSMELPGDGIHEGTLTLKREEWTGSVEVKAFLVRSGRNRSVPSGFATEHGSLLAWSEPVQVLLDEPVQPPGDRLEVRWENFSESGNTWRRSNTNSIFALDMNGERPVIFLNSGISRAVEILGSAGTRGRKARIRDATNYMIAHQVWSSLLTTALAKVATDEDLDEDATLEDRLRDLEDWEARVIRDWSRYLYPDRDTEPALAELVSAAGDAGKTKDVMTLLPNAIQERFSTFRGFEGLVREGESL